MEWNGTLDGGWVCVLGWKWSGGDVGAGEGPGMGEWMEKIYEMLCCPSYSMS